MSVTDDFKIKKPCFYCGRIGSESFPEIFPANSICRKCGRIVCSGCAAHYERNILLSQCIDKTSCSSARFKLGEQLVFEF